MPTRRLSVCMDQTPQSSKRLDCPVATPFRNFLAPWMES
jgi:hypothetical protein